MAIDPGLRACGVAVFYDWELQSCLLLENNYSGDDRPELWRGMFEALQHCSCSWPCDVLVVEKPQIYERSPDKNNLVDLSIVAGAAALAISSEQVVDYWPHDWKGTVKKEIMTKRIQDWMSPREKLLLPALPKSKLHNVVDAIGLGIHHLSTLGLRQKKESK